MSGLNGILETARRALAAQRMGLNVTGHNIANVNTLGYSRQTADLTSTLPLRTSVGFLGTGVTVDSVMRVHDRFMDQQVRFANDALGSATSQHRILGQVESVFNEPSDNGLNALLGRFFNAFQDLSVHPEDMGPRNVVLQTASQLATTFNRLSADLHAQRANVAGEINAKLGSVNKLTREISELDRQIASAGSNANDLKDQRDLRIDQLSKMINISVSQDSQGGMVVSTGGTVISSRAGSVELKTVSSGPTLGIVAGSSGQSVNIGSGEIGGALNVHNTLIPDYLSKLDTLATTIMSRVNTIHSAGYGLGTPPPTGINFFTGTSAGTMGVNSALLNNPGGIAASGDGSPGNNSVALALAAIASENLFGGNTQTITQFYGSLMSSMGASVNAADSTARTQEMVLVQLETQRAAISGVSLDEEMTNLIKFQRAFDAAARMVNTTNELFDTVLGMV